MKTENIEECAPLLTISDSIAINILNENHILRGVGNELHLHGKRNTVVLKTRLKAKIHGIIKGSGANARKILVFGEKEFVLLEWKENFKEEFDLLHRGWLSDWISSAIFIDDTSNFLLLTAHSVILHIKYKKLENLNTCEIIGRFSCNDKSTLYCAHLSGNNVDNLVVFGGNAFGELLIWEPRQSFIKQDKTEAPLLRRISAHNGVIFSIDYEPDTRILITTSDDRSIKFWQVAEADDWSKAIVRPIASGYGHMARVFQGKIIKYGDSMLAITVGEDSYFCLWRCNGELLFKCRVQSGATIWNLAYDTDNQTLYTVGSTGNLTSHNLRILLENRCKHTAKEIVFVNDSDQMEYIAKTKFLTKNFLIGITNRNRLFMNDLRINTWLEVPVRVDYKCTCLEVSGNLIALCGYRRLILFEFIDNGLQKTFDENLLSGVIRSFHFLSQEKYLLSDDAGNCLLLADKGSKKFEIELPKCKERWLTSAAMFGDEKYLLVSNRLGNVILYEFDLQSENFILKHTLKHPHGYLGATLLKIKEQSKTSTYIQSAGHDGSLKTLYVDYSKASVSVKSRHNVPISWIESAVEVDSSELFLGFNDNHFVMWSELQDTFLQVPCGGGHRCWHYLIYEVKNVKRIQLAFIKNKKILLHNLSLLYEFGTEIAKPIRNRWHVRNTNVLEIIEAKEFIAVSAGDDNLIKVSTLTFDNNTANITQQAEIHSHISNIRAIKCLKINVDEYLIISGGGRAQLCLTQLCSKTFKTSELLIHTLNTSTDKTKTEHKHSFDPETRIMSIDALSSEESQQLHIYIACSDGFLRYFSLNKDFFIESEREIFYGKCLLQVRIVADKYLLSSASDGKVCLYDLTLKNLLYQIPLNSSGINALDFYLCPSTEILHLLTGGDDQAVFYAQVSVESIKEPILLEKLHLPQLHTAQVTAARFSSDRNYAFTSGVDQNLIKFDLKRRNVENVTHSCIADIKGLTITNKDKNLCLVYGCGLQVFYTQR